MWWKIVSSILLLGISSYSAASPLVIYDSGKTQPMQFYFKPMSFEFTPPKNLQFKISNLPVSTPSMTAGTVHPRQINKPHLTQPFFIVGADMFSHTWLRKHGQRLKALNAIGIAVNVSTQKQLNQLIHSSGGLAINPVPGEVISSQLLLKHYPALISATAIEQ